MFFHLLANDNNFEFACRSTININHIYTVRVNKDEGTVLEAKNQLAQILGVKPLQIQLFNTAYMEHALADIVPISFFADIANNTRFTVDIKV